MALSQWKEAILEGIFIEIKDGVVEEKNLERLENLVEILHKEGSKVPESVKEAYSQVAVECTARCLGSERDAKVAYTEAIRSIWLRRIMPLCDKVSCLVTSDLLNSCRRLWMAHNDEKACETLMEENTREKALVALRKVVTELDPNHGYAYDDGNAMDESEEVESSEESRETEPIVEASEDGDEDQDTEQERPSGESEAESPLRQIKTISSAVVDRQLKKLRASKIDLMNALEQGGPSTLHNATITEQVNDVANPSETTTLPRPSLMERRTTAQTFEWEDSIDDSDVEMGADGEKNNKPRRERIVVSPLKKRNHREKVYWSTAETLAVMKGYEKYGANWKRIKDENPILERRTNVNIKDKYRVEMRRKERNLE
ncbi:hypothetical protein EUTSA_v10007960mg [Eutrema salsugineum]|uniref:Uncharacterized protein n=1 Tax=Eutrema salsugineum TaxID=72664 RepID=V4L1S3_EUTSA|nr:uncharacterized protein LOC18994185 [Eutrema salsugineum]XP_024007817.1 uncharacterized protein LOC18994185 [Eutrema salsugineum]ESQ36222.1 hypothetical protein EUTSA_v10007960mg [Eutrema salsugineum]